MRPQQQPGAEAACPANSRIARTRQTRQHLLIISTASRGPDIGHRSGPPIGNRVKRRDPKPERARKTGYECRRSTPQKDEQRTCLFSFPLTITSLESDRLPTHKLRPSWYAAAAATSLQDATRLRLPSPLPLHLHLERPDSLSLLPSSSPATSSPSRGSRSGPSTPRAPRPKRSFPSAAKRWKPVCSASTVRLHTLITD